MAIAHVQTPAVVVVTAQSSNRAFASNVTAGNTIIVCVVNGVGGGAAIVTSVTDTLSNTYVQAGVGNTHGNFREEIWYALNISGGSCTVTVNMNKSTDLSFTISEFSGIATSSAVDVTGGATGTSTQATVNLTTTNSDDVLVGVMDHAGSTQALTSGTNFTMLQESEAVAKMPIHSEYRIVTSTGTYAVPVDIAASVAWGIYAASFKQAAAGGLSIPIAMFHYQHHIGSGV